MSASEAITMYRIANLRLDGLYKDATSCELSSDSVVLGKFKVKYRDLEQIKSDFLESYKLMELKPSKTFDIDNHSAQLEEFMDKVYSIIVKYESLFGSEKPVIKNDQQLQSKGSLSLPKIKLPSFKGEYTQWSSFIAMFNSLIHNNLSLSQVEKMHYLITSLSGDAASLVKHLNISDENYNVAYNLLLYRYENTRLIADSHLEYILNLPNITSKNVRVALDSLRENLNALEALKMPVHDWGFILLHILLRKLESHLRTDFELHIKNINLPKCKDLLEFLELRARALENTNLSLPPPKEVIQSKRTNPKLGYASSIEKNCLCCDRSGHPLYTCRKFLGMNPASRKELVQTKHLCFNCLSQHHISKCSSQYTCKYCKGRHHSLIHLPRPSGGQTFNSQENNSQLSCPDTTEVAALSSMYQSVKQNVYTTVLLATASIHIENGTGQWGEARALIDPGAQSSFITSSCVRRLRLPVTNNYFAVSVLGGHQAQRTEGSVAIKLKPRFSPGPVFNTSACVMQQLTKELPSSSLPESMAQHFEGFILADPLFFKKGKIDFILGADLYDQILINCSPVRLLPELPSAIQTKLGFVLMGKTCSGQNSSSSDLASFHSSCENYMDQFLERFWESEECPSSTSHQLSPNDLLCEEHFQNTHSRDLTGRFSVQLPFKKEFSSLGESRDIALRRFYALERRLNKDDVLKKMYSDFLYEYEQLGHMTQISNPLQNLGLYFIAHHGVLRLTSSTTKLRVVYDASMASSNGLSLNQVLYAGPKLQQDIVNIITRFRVHAVVFTSDIKQMYRQINVQGVHRPYQRILWRAHDTDPVKEYELNTVTYGVSASPFLAMRCLRQLAEDAKHEHAKASRVVLHDVFVDDVVTGAPSLEEALHLKTELVSLLRSGGFELRKWCSNSNKLLSTVPSDHCEVPLEYGIEGDTIMKILGLKWNSQRDCFLYTAHLQSDTYTKRSLLSNIARLYDPCGWLAPATFKAKSMMQRLWLLQIGWDESPPDDLINEWKLFAGSFSSLQDVSIPRHLKLAAADCQLHAFSDASEKGYAACVYLRVQGAQSTDVLLLIAKSKVSPLKQRLTIPKLELNGALLAAKLVDYIKHTLSHVEFSLCTIWCDSTIVLSWLQTSPHSLRMYEGNRVSQIHALADPATWRYVPSSMNPADAASRGLYPHELVNHPLWWDVPWLSQLMETWPSRKVIKAAPVLDGEETNISLDCLVGVRSETVEETNPIISRYSKLAKLIRVVALCQRFGHNCRSKTKLYGFISSSELQQALHSLVIIVQSQVFFKDLALIRQGRSHKSSLARLAPFVDEQGFLRVGGRLKNSSLPFAAKHPLLLPRHHHLTDLIIDDYHSRYLHPGPNSLLSFIRQKFWIPSGKQAVKGRVSKCLTCFKNRPRSSDPFMGDLPADRVTPSKAFCSVAADFAGPFMIKESKLRKARLVKVYLCIFVCFATKACHLEVVSDLSTEAFLATFHRFTARRGLCRDIYTDNGTNFRGAHNHLREVYSFFSKHVNLGCLNDKLALHQVTWHFSPASAPHFNGLAEAAVKSAKHHVVRVVGQQHLTFEELSTLFCRVEAVLNSRPLCPLSADPNDLSVLTPGHFLIGQSLTSVPEHDLSDVSLNRLSRWQLLQRLSHGFWKQWSSEYLHTLQQRQKWIQLQASLQLDDLVLIKEDNLPPLQWKLGRVTELHPGKDSTLRVVSVRTQAGTLVRPVVKLCPLPN